jgi:hypothetical protein
LVKVAGSASDHLDASDVEAGSDGESVIFNGGKATPRTTMSFA